MALANSAKFPDTVLLIKDNHPGLWIPPPEVVPGQPSATFSEIVLLMTVILPRL